MADIVRYILSDFEGCKVLSLSGNLSVNTISSIEEMLDEITNSNNLIIDMGNVTLLTSSGIESLIEISQNAYAKENRVVFCQLKKEFKNMFMLLAISHLLLFADTVKEAAMKIHYYT